MEFSGVNTTNKKGDLLKSYTFWKRNLQIGGITKSEGDANLFNLFNSIGFSYDYENKIYNKYKNKNIPTSFYESDIELIDVKNTYVKDTYVNLYNFIEIETKIIYSLTKIYNSETVINNEFEELLDGKEILKDDKRLTKLGFNGEDIYNKISNVLTDKKKDYETQSREIHNIINPIVLKMYETYIPLMFIYEKKNGKEYENYYILKESILDNKIERGEIDEINISYVHIDDLIQQFINKLVFDIKGQLGENYITKFYEKREYGDIKILDEEDGFNFYKMATKIINGKSPIIELPIQNYDNQEGGIKMKRFKKKHVNKKKKQSIKKKRTKKQNKKTIKNKKKQKQQKKNIKKKKTLKKK